MSRLLILLCSFMMLSAFDWREVDVEPAYDALRVACSHHKPTMQDRAFCMEFWKRKLESPEGKQRWFERTYDIKPLTDEGLLTGYYLPLLEGSRTPSEVYPCPVWGVPKEFKKPYLTRQQIDQGALKNKETPILWVKDKVDLFFLHIQGSGRVQLPDGTMVGLGFAAKNGQEYRSIGKLLLQEGVMEKHEISLQSLKTWLRANPDQIDRTLWHNPSYIFFNLQEDPQAIGAQNIPLTPKGSLAVDPKHISYGTPVLIETTLPNESESRFILTIAQDTGSAIKSEKRADWFLGFGSQAEALAGEMKQPARFWLLERKRQAP